MKNIWVLAGLITVAVILSAGCICSVNAQSLSRSRVGNSYQGQGLAYDGTYYYYITDTGISKYDSNWNLVTSNPNAAGQCGSGVAHISELGDGKVYNGVLYAIAVDGSTNAAYLGMWETSNLNFIRSVNLAEVRGTWFQVPPTGPQSSASGVTVNPSAHALAVVSYGEAPPPQSNGIQGAIFLYDLRTFAYKGVISPSHTMWNSQGIDYYNGHYYVSADSDSQAHQDNFSTGGVFMESNNGGGVTRIIPYSRFTNGGEIQGIDVKSTGIRVECGVYVYTFTAAPPYDLVQTVPQPTP
ncbi:MAG: hypothetical protein WCB79_01840 [Halobacteriota archaeon]